MNGKIRGGLRLFAALAMAIAFFCVSLALYVSSSDERRYIFVFETADSSGRALESRFLNAYKTEEEALRLYVEELLLGPLSNKLLPLFDSASTVDSCFLRDRVLYISVSQTAYDMSTASAGVALLKENVLRNFPDIADIIIFINGSQEEGSAS